MAHVSNPSVPYIGPIGPLHPGGIIQISGHIPPNAKWFAINLQCGPNTNPRDDIALHINPRFEGNLSKVVRNWLQSQQWGMEENFGHFPFSHGQQFEVLLLAEPDMFKIAVNGQHYTEFRHRLPMNRVTTIAIDGDVQLFSIRYEPPSSQAQSYSSGMPGQTQYSGQQAHQMPAPPYGQAGYSAPPGPGLGFGAPSQPPGYGPPPGYQPPNPSTSGSPYGYGGYSQPAPSSSYLHATSSPMPVPGTSPGFGRKSPSMLPGITAGAGAGVLGGVAAYGLSKLMYPHGMGHGHGMGKKMKFKHKYKKPKFPKHKGFKHKWHKKGHKGWKHGGWGSSSSSSSESE